jgi:hypothetical protein
VLPEGKTVFSSYSLSVRTANERSAGSSQPCPHPCPRAYRGRSPSSPSRRRRPRQEWVLQTNRQVGFAVGSLSAFMDGLIREAQAAG